MDIFEKLNKAFAGWYESWFGDAVSDLRPKDILRKIIETMEDNRKEGLDNRIYVPNKYILEITFHNDEEREYLLAFLDKEELEAALRKYMAQNKYYLRGPLDFTVEEVEAGDCGKLHVKCKWDIRPVEKEVEARIPPSPAEAVPGTPYEEEEYTVAATDIYDEGTVAPPSLSITQADGSSQRFLLNKPVTMIGRSRRLNNDLVLEKDGMVSKRHAQIALGSEGFSITDLNSTNGVWINGEKVASGSLKDGDRITLGATEMVFEGSGSEPRLADRVPGCCDRPRLMIGRAGGLEEFRLASEVTIGKSLTSDVRLTDPSVGSRHARVFSRDGTAFYIEDLDSKNGTFVNGDPVPSGVPVKLLPGDNIKIGEVEMTFERT